MSAVRIVAIVVGAVLLSLWRWSMPIVCGGVLVWVSYSGHWLMFPLAIVVAGEIVSAWTERPWTMVVWRLVRPNPIDRMTPAWKAAFERARERDMRRNIK